MDRAILDQLLPALQQSSAGLLGAYAIPAAADGYFLRDRFEDALLLLFSDDLSIHSAREALLRTRVDWGQVFETPPYVHTPATLARVARLFPLFHRHLARHAEHLQGQLLPIESARKVHPVELLAFLITEAMAASAALLPDYDESDAMRRLQRLAHNLSGNEVDAGAPPAALFSQVQVHLRLVVDSLPSLARHRRPLVKSSGEPNLLAFYEDHQRLLAVIPPLSANLLQKIDWPAVARGRSDYLTTLNVATSDQFYLALQAYRPLDYVLGSFRRLWGADLLKGLTVAARGVFRQAARKPAQLLAGGALGDYLLAPNAKALHQVIHDYQNRLLNIRLQHELLCRHCDIPLEEPPLPLPRRDEPLSARIDAIVQHLNWWADHYSQHMESRQPAEKMSPL